MKITLHEAKQLLQSGQVVALPTETVYGLAAWLHNEEAVKRIFALKGRPSFNPLIIHIGQKNECLPYLSKIPHGLSELTAAFWPGPLTIVLPIRQELIPAIARAHLLTAAFRMPNHAITLELLQQISPIVAPSANLSGSPSATRPEHVENDFGCDFPLLDGGNCLHGVESTILAQENERWQIARLGAISPEAIARVLGYLPLLAGLSQTNPISPGQLLAHYAPKCRLVLSNLSFEKCPNQLPYVVGFADERYPGAQKVFTLGDKQGAEVAAYRLYEVLRQLDQEQISEAWVDMAFPDNGLWITIRERLNRAANR